MDDIESLRYRLIPADTPLRDVPPDWRGLSWSEYMQVFIAEERTRAYQARKADEEPQINKKRISSSRDHHGRRSLPAGTRYLGF